MIIRFVEGTHSLISWDIEARENVAMPLRPSHVEMLSRDGAHYIGAHIDGGIQARPIGLSSKSLGHQSGLMRVAIYQANSTAMATAAATTTTTNVGSRSCLIPGSGMKLDNAMTAAMKKPKIRMPPSIYAS